MLACICQHSSIVPHSFFDNPLDLDLANLVAIHLFH